MIKTKDKQTQTMTPKQQEDITTIMYFLRDHFGKSESNTAVITIGEFTKMYANEYNRNCIFAIGGISTPKNIDFITENPILETIFSVIDDNVYIKGYRLSTECMICKCKNCMCDDCKCSCRDLLCKSSCQNNYRKCNEYKKLIDRRRTTGSDSN